MLYTYHMTVMELNAMKLHRFNDLNTWHRPEIFALFKETQWNSMKLMLLTKRPSSCESQGESQPQACCQWPRDSANTSPGKKSKKPRS